MKLETRKLINQSDATKYLKLLTSIPVSIIETDKVRTLRLALELGLPHYDACYVDAAIKADTELCTTDELLASRISELAQAAHSGLPFPLFYNSRMKR